MTVGRNGDPSQGLPYIVPETDWNANDKHGVELAVQTHCVPNRFEPCLPAHWPKAPQGRAGLTMASGPLPACAGGPTDKAWTLRNVPLRTQFPAQTRERRRIGSFRVRLWNQHQARWVSCSKRRHRRMPWDAESYFGCSVCLFPSSSYCCLSSTIEPRSVAHHAGRLRALLLEAMRVDSHGDRVAALSWCGTTLGY